MARKATPAATGVVHLVLMASHSVSAIRARASASGERPAVLFRLLRLSAVVAVGHDK